MSCYAPGETECGASEPASYPERVTQTPVAPVSTGEDAESVISASGRVFADEPPVLPAVHVPHGGRSRGIAPRSRLAAYVALTKPRIIELLLVTTLPSMVLAAEGLPDWLIAVATMVGGT